MNELAELRKENAELRAALEDLVDWQNGPPLLSKKWLDGWNDAMTKAHKALKFQPWERMEK